MLTSQLDSGTLASSPSFAGSEPGTNNQQPAVNSVGPSHTTRSSHVDTKIINQASGKQRQREIELALQPRTISKATARGEH